MTATFIAVVVPLPTIVPTVADVAALTPAENATVFAAVPAAPPISAVVAATDVPLMPATTQVVAVAAVEAIKPNKDKISIFHLLK